MQITFITELILIFLLFCERIIYFFNVKLKKFNCKVINMEFLLIKSEGDLG